MPQGDPTHKHIMTAQNVYSGYLYAVPLKGTTPSGPDVPEYAVPSIVRKSKFNSVWKSSTLSTPSVLGIMEHVSILP